MLRIKPKRLAGIIRHFPLARILVVGDVMMDEYIWGKVTRISPEAPVPVLNVSRETIVPGGAANVARNIYSLEAKVYLAGVIGRDRYGRVLLKQLRQNNVDTNGLQVNRSGNTILKTRVIAHKQQVVRIDKEKGTMPALKNIDKINKYINGIITDIDGVIIEDYGKGIISQKLVSSLIDLCIEKNKLLIVDPKKGHLLDYTGATAVTPNLEEALAIAGLDYNGEYVQKKVDKAGRIIMDKWKLRNVLITLGGDGICLIGKESKAIRIPTAAMDVYDVSGAGDTVAAVFTAALASGASMYEAAVLSNISAGIVVGKIGTAVPTIKELLDAIKT